MPFRPDLLHSNSSSASVKLKPETGDCVWDVWRRQEESFVSLSPSFLPIFSSSEVGDASLLLTVCFALCSVLFDRTWGDQKSMQAQNSLTLSSRSQCAGGSPDFLQ